MIYHSRTLLLKALVVGFCLLSTSITSFGQQSAVYNINKYNGLSSNHVYRTLVDRHGYLWLTTTDGVYRYNGYSMQRYDYNDGLANTDVWDMYEDREGRIWLLSIANGIGYIRDNVYHPAIIRNDSVSEKIYPGAFMENNSSILFSLKNIVDGAILYGVIRGDTVELKKWNFDIFKRSVYITQDKVVITSPEPLMSYYPMRLLLQENKSIPAEKVIKPEVNFVAQYGGRTRIHRIHKNTAYFSDAKTSTVFFFDFDKNIASYVTTDEDIVHIHDYRNGIYILTGSSAYHLSSKAKITDTFRYNSLFNSTSKKKYAPTHFMSYRFWGKCLSTNNEGTYLNYGIHNIFAPLGNSFANYKYVSAINDSTAYWWNDRENNLATVINGKIVSSTQIRGNHTVNHILPFSKGKSLLLAAPLMKWLDENNQMTDFLNTDSLVYNGRTLVRENLYSGFFGDFLSYISDGCIIDSTNFLFLGTAFVGAVHVQIDPGNNKIYVRTFDGERFKRLLYYSAGGYYLIYNDSKVLLYNAVTRKKSTIPSRTLKALGIQRIEQIATDSHGNIIVKDYDKLYLFNPITGVTKKIFPNYRLRDAFISAQGNTLSIAGNFGVIRCNTTSSGNITNSHTFPNIKNLVYKYIYDVQFSEKNVLLKTDNGAYLVDIDNTDISGSDTYRLIINNSNTLYNISTNDTLHVQQTTGALGVDVIKPTGTGNLNISYSINGGTFNNTGYQVILPNLKPGTYNTVSLIASDDSWRSKPIKFTVYVAPKWWQTQTAKRIIFVLSLLAFIGFVYLVVVMTRRMVNRNNERRNQRRELELKSIYSQINPHFIFNSLSTAQYFVKKNRNKEAFDHINQFSDLLRAYIKSSRAKYITIAEEIENLENYLELQLTRFEEKFSYSIAVDPSVDPQKVKIPSLLLQPLVENALNHGIFHSETKGRLNISFKIDERDKDTLVCIVDDNGVGRQSSKELRGKIIRKADSYGTILIKELIDTFNKYEKINIGIEYIDKQLPLTGTTVIIRIKNFTHAQ